MTTSEQHKAIATACGLNLCQLALADIWGHTTDGKTWENFPDYTSDLNAMHEAEKVLTSPQVTKYTHELRYITRSVEELFDQELAVINHATAAQRAEAFLKTLNLWTDNES